MQTTPKTWFGVKRNFTTTKSTMASADFGPLQHQTRTAFQEYQSTFNNVVNPRMHLPFGDGLYQPFMVVLGASSAVRVFVGVRLSLSNQNQ